MKYRIKDVTNRNNTDLRNHSQNIRLGVQAVFPNAYVNVYQYYFEIINLSSIPSDSQLRKMGQEIVKRDSYLHSLAKQYNYTRSDGTPGKSVQLFEKFD